MKYIAVSQGIKIAEFENKDLARLYAHKQNKIFLDYYQKCLDQNEIPADNRVYIYEETEDE